MFGTDQQTATIIRRQTENGESVDVVLEDRTLTWRIAEGVRGLSSSPTEIERLLAERLILTVRTSLFLDNYGARAISQLLAMYDPQMQVTIIAARCGTWCGLMSLNRMRI
jgi:hypothetical protein